MAEREMVRLPSLIPAAPPAIPHPIPMRLSAALPTRPAPVRMERRGPARRARRLARLLTVGGRPERQAARAAESERRPVVRPVLAPRCHQVWMYEIWPFNWQAGQATIS